MPLYVLVPMILVGLPLVIGLVYLTTRGAPVAPLDEQRVAERFRIDYPGLTHDHVILSEDGKAAILLSQETDDIGLVYAVGNKYLTRLLGRDDVRAISAADSKLTLRLRDFTLARISMTIANQRDLQEIVERLE